MYTIISQDRFKVYRNGKLIAFYDNPKRRVISTHGAIIVERFNGVVWLSLLYCGPSDEITVMGMNKPFKFMPYKDSDGFVWIYECGWRLEGHHPYRSEYGLTQSVGIMEFYQHFGIKPVYK